MSMVMRMPPSREQLEQMINPFQYTIEQRLENLRILYDCIDDRDREIERQRKIVDNREREIERLKAEVQQLRRELRSRPKTADQLRAIVARSEKRIQVLEKAHEAAQAASRAALELEQLLEEAVTAPD